MLVIAGETLLNLQVIKLANERKVRYIVLGDMLCVRERKVRYIVLGDMLCVRFDNPRILGDKS
jgi:hypothetical protein